MRQGLLWMFMSSINSNMRQGLLWMFMSCINSNTYEDKMVHKSDSLELKFLTCSIKVKGYVWIPDLFLPVSNPSI